jgi:hypothetical protein
MKTRVALTLVATALSAGCAPLPDRYDVRVSDQFTDEQIAGIRQAVDAWNAGLGAHVLSVEVGSPCDPAPDVCVQPTTLAANNARSGGTETWGYTQKERWVYLDTDAVPEADFPQVAAHELGHAMGLVHTGPGTLMCASAKCASPTVTQADDDQWYELRGVGQR